MTDSLAGKENKVGVKNTPVAHNYGKLSECAVARTKCWNQMKKSNKIAVQNLPISGVRPVHRV